MEKTTKILIALAVIIAIVAIVGINKNGFWSYSNNVI